MHYHHIDTLSMANSNEVLGIAPAQALTLDSPASLVTTDFSAKAPLVIEPDVTIDQALFMMKKAHVKAKLVVDDQNRFLGIVSLADLHSHKVLMAAEKRDVPRGEVQVGDVMTSKVHLHGLSRRKLESATIGDVVYTLQALGEQHILILEQDGHIGGMISSSDMARALHIPLNIADKASSFADVFAHLRPEQKRA